MRYNSLLWKQSHASLPLQSFFTFFICLVNNCHWIYLLCLSNCFLSLQPDDHKSHIKPNTRGRWGWQFLPLMIPDLSCVVTPYSIHCSLVIVNFLFCYRWEKSFSLPAQKGTRNENAKIPKIVVKVTSNFPTRNLSQVCMMLTRSKILVSLLHQVALSRLWRVKTATSIVRAIAMKVPQILKLEIMWSRFLYRQTLVSLM